MLDPVPKLEELVVVSSRYSVRDARTRSHAVDLAAASVLPKLGEDPLRVTAHLPGIGTNGVSAKPHIRGGVRDELLVLFNNIVLLEPFHLRDFQSVFSTFNPGTIDSIDVYTGGFPARYGDRMSGVMDITPRLESVDAEGEITLSTLNLALMGRGALSGERGSWMASARRGALDLLTKEINPSVGTPSYEDAFAQLVMPIGAQADLDLGLFAYNDDIELRDFDEDGEIASSRYENVYAWAQLHYDLGARWSGASLMYFSGINHRRDGILVDEDLDDGSAAVDDRRSFHTWTLSQWLRFDGSRRLSAELGFSAQRVRGNYDYHARIERGELAELIGNGLRATRAARLRPSGHVLAGFGSIRFRPLETLTLEFGARVDRQDFGLGSEDTQFSPRLSARVQLNDRVEARLSAGRFYQPEGIHELKVGDGLERYQRAQYADHYILGVHVGSGDSGWSMRAELFQKDYPRPHARFENLFNPLVLLPELSADRVAIAPTRARVYGAEVSVRYRRDERLSAWLAYTRSRARDRFGGRWIDRAWSQDHSVTAGVGYQGERWRIGATVLWHDGWRTTRLPDTIEAGRSITLSPYQGRLRDFLSIDLQVARRWQRERWAVEAFLEVTNAVGRHNVGGIEYEVEAEAGAFELEPVPETLLPLVPSLGVRIEF